MRLTRFLLLASASLGLPASAQTPPPGHGTYTIEREVRVEHRAVLGVTTRATGSLRDTLGLLISGVSRGGPAERAGLEEGNRIAAINGVNLRATAVDIEDAEASGMLSSRLIRELGKVKAGDEVELRVYREGRTSVVKLRTADSDSLFGRRDIVRVMRSGREDRPALGFGIGSTGSRRDSLGVFVMSVADSTPAARAGIEEGNRIAAINGINLRVPGEDSADRGMGGLRAQRLQREIANLTPGSDVTLRVWANGQYRDVRMKVARASELPRRASNMTIIRDGGLGDFEGFGMMGPRDIDRPMSPPPPPRTGRPGTPQAEEHDIRIEIGGELRQQLNVLRRELDLLGPELDSIGPALERLRPELERLQVDIPKAVRRAREAAMGTTAM